MTDERYIIITVVYERHTEYAQALEWIAPELSNARLSLIDDHAEEPSPSRTWAGIVPASTFNRFAHAWQLPEASSKPTSGNTDRHPATRVYTLDGMNWDAGGQSPIVSVTVQVLATSAEHGVRAHGRPLPFTHIG